MTHTRPHRQHTNTHTNTHTSATANLNILIPPPGRSPPSHQRHQQLCDTRPPEDLDPQVGLPPHVLHACVELRALVHVGPAGVAPHAHGQHHAHLGSEGGGGGKGAGGGGGGGGKEGPGDGCRMCCATHEQLRRRMGDIKSSHATLRLGTSSSRRSILTFICLSSLRTRFCRGSFAGSKSCSSGGCRLRGRCVTQGEGWSRAAAAAAGARGGGGGAGLGAPQRPPVSLRAAQTATHRWEVLVEDFALAHLAVLCWLLALVRRRLPATAWDSSLKR